MRRFDEPNGSAEDPGQMRDALAEHLLREVETRKGLVHSRHWSDLSTKLKIGKKVIEMPVDNIEAVEPAEEDGTFLVHLKNGVLEHADKIALVSGGALLAAAWAIHLAKKKKN